MNEKWLNVWQKKPLHTIYNCISQIEYRWYMCNFSVNKFLNFPSKKYVLILDVIYKIFESILKWYVV